VLCIFIISLEELIEEERKYSCLWNKSKPEYRNQNIRDNAWERISGELKKTGKHISNFYFYCKMQSLNLVGRYLSKN
jgi:hypothetical protein